MVNNRTLGQWLLPAHVAKSRSTLATLQRDFARLRSLEHPHIARLHELGCNGQQYYVTGERLDGEPLREVLTHLLPEHLDVGEADDILRAIGSALVYAHEHGVVHGDVRAENVLVTMDRRFMLTNFLARRIAKVAGRPARPSDDLTGLARLAAELYTGSASPQALRGAAHRSVPTARLTAIRAVLEGPARRRPAGVAEFLAAAGLAFASAAVPEGRARPSQRSWSLWRLVLPMAAAIVIGTLIASYHAAGSDWRDSALELQRRGLGALRAVASRVTPPAPAEANDAAGPPLPVETAQREQAPAAAGSAAAAAPPSAAETLAERIVEPAADPPPPAKPATAPAPAPEPTAAAPATTTAAVRRGDPAVLSLGQSTVAAREDHSVVAIDVVRSGDVSREIDVGWWTSPGTADEEDDYAGGRRMVTFPAGATTERVLIPIVNDGVREPDEVFTVHLSRPRNGVTGSVTATRVTLYDDD